MDNNSAVVMLLNTVNDLTRRITILENMANPTYTTVTQPHYPYGYGQSNVSNDWVNTFDDVQPRMEVRDGNLYITIGDNDGPTVNP